MARAAALPILTAESGLSRYLEEIRRFPMLEPQEEYMLAKRWREHGDRDAAHKLVTSHLRLVAKIAMGYRGYGLPISEVISEGNVGLMQAVKRFEPEKGFRLATYAMWWIKAAIQEYILRSWSLVKMGTTANQKKLFFNLRKAKSKISALDEGDMRPDQVKLIAKRLGVTEQDVIDMNRRLGGDASLNAPIREDGDAGEWQDWLVDDAADQERILAESEEADNRHAALVAGARRAQRSRTPHLRGAPPGRRSDHAGGTRGGIRRLARARAPDRGARLREGAEGGEEPRRHHGSAGGASRRRRAITSLHSFSFVMAALVAAISPSNALLRSSDGRNKSGHDNRNVTVSAAWRRRILAPGVQGFLEGAVAWNAFFYRQQGALPVVIDQADVHPGPLLQQLHIAPHVALHRGKAEQEKAAGNFHPQPGKRRAASLFGIFHQHARHVGDAAGLKIRRRAEQDLDRVACRERLVEITPQR